MQRNQFNMLKGSCLCGQVRYTYNGIVEELSMCHCSQCRKAQGTAVTANSPLKESDLHFEGKDFIKEYNSSGDKVRAFCSQCGSALYSAKSSVPGIKRIRLGTVDTAFTCQNKYHIHADSIASWHEITDQHPQFKQAKKG